LWQYGWYDWCYFRESTAPFPHEREVLGRVLAHGFGNEMAQWVLKPNGEVVPRRTHRPLHDDEVRNPMIQKQQGFFDEAIERGYGKAISSPKTDPANE